MSVGTSTGDASFRGTSSSTRLSFVIIVAITFLVVTTVVLSGTPFGNAFALLLGGVVFALADNLDAVTLDVVFFVGEIAVVVVVEDFALVTRDFAAVAVAAGADARPVFGIVVDDAPVVLRPREIRLLAVSLICLSIIGDFTVLVLARFSRVLAAPLEAGAVLGLDMLRLTPLVVAGFDDEVVVVLVAGEADMGRGFDVAVDNGILADAGDDLTSVVAFVAPLLPVVLLLVVDLAVVGLLLVSCFASPFAVVGFLSDIPLVVLDFCEVAEALAVTFGLVETELSREDTVVFVVAVVAVLAAVVVFVAVLLFAVVVETAALAGPSSCLGRAAGGFFVAADWVALVARAVVVPTAALEGEVGGDFVDAFVVDALVFVVVVEVVFAGRFGVVEVVFVLLELVTTSNANAKAVAAFEASEFFEAILSGAVVDSATSSSFGLSVGNSTISVLFAETLSVVTFSSSVSLLIGISSTSFLFSFSWAGTLLGTKVSLGASSNRSDWAFSLCGCSSMLANTFDTAALFSSVTSTFVSAASSLLNIDSL